MITKIGELYKEASVLTPLWAGIKGAFSGLKSGVASNFPKATQFFSGITTGARNGMHAAKSNMMLSSRNSNILSKMTSEQKKLWEAHRADALKASGQKAFSTVEEAKLLNKYIGNEANGMKNLYKTKSSYNPRGWGSRLATGAAIGVPTLGLGYAMFGGSSQPTINNYNYRY